MATEKRLKGYDPITLESFTRHITKHREPYDQYDMGYVDAVERIENFLEYNTVDAAEVVHGRWIPSENGGYHCSVCDKRFGFVFDNHYCPNCGADMRGDGNG